MAGNTDDTQDLNTGNTSSLQEEAFFNMSDEEFEKLQYADSVVPTEEGTQERPDDLEDGSNEEPQGDEAAAELEESSEEEDTDDDDQHEEEAGTEEESETEEDESESDSEDDSEGTEDTKDGVNYEAAYKELFSPFKANGKEIQVDSVEDARQLMQMGANYSKKMSALKPNLKHMKLLEDNKLLSDDKINYLIDIASGKPEAIKQLLKESKIDPMDLDLDKADDYQPSQRTVDDKRLEMDDVLGNLQESQNYQRLVNEVGNGWDEDSLQAIAKAPKVLEILDNHMATGIYDRILERVERERLMGRLGGMSSLDAYHAVGDQLHAEGAFNDLGQAPASQPAPKRSEAERMKKDQEEQRRKSKKRAAGSTRKAPSQSKPVSDFNPLSMSDEEYEKFSSKYS